MTDTTTRMTGTPLVGPAAPPDFLADLLLEVRAGRALLATWPPSTQVREACACLAAAAAAVADAQHAMTEQPEQVAP